MSESFLFAENVIVLGFWTIIGGPRMQLISSHHHSDAVGKCLSYQLPKIHVSYADIILHSNYQVHFYGCIRVCLQGIKMSHSSLVYNNTEDLNKNNRFRNFSAFWKAQIQREDQNSQHNLQFHASTVQSGKQDRLI